MSPAGRIQSLTVVNDVWEPGLAGANTGSDVPIPNPTVSVPLVVPSLLVTDAPAGYNESGTGREPILAQIILRKFSICTQYLPFLLATGHFYLYG